MELLDGLDPSQRAAVASEAQPLCILAGAGSGKTRVLTRRVAHRVATGTAEADHVLVLTFTRKAAGELRRRLRQLGVRGDVAAGTFHAVAYAQLRRLWAERRRPPLTVLDRKVRLLAPLLPRTPSGGAAVQPADVATEIEWAKARMVAPEGYEAEAAAADRAPPLPAGTMASVYGRYEEAKGRKGLLDLDDLLLHCARALEDDAEFAAAQRWRFRHFFVDEFQDVNPAQFRLLQGWLGGRPDLCVVGDPDQSIYSWTGADPTLLTGFARRFPGSEVLRLERNYRSTPQVVAVGRACLEGPGTGRPGGGAFVAVRPDGPVPVVRRFDNDAAEARGVARALRRAHRPGLAWSHLAVLARTNAQLVLLEQHLRAAGVPCRATGGALLQQPEVKAALAQLAGAARATPFASRLSDVEAMAAEAADAGGEAAERRANLEALVRLGRDYAALDPAATPESFAAWLATAVQGDHVAAGADVVELTTFHRAKGLEWPVVFVVGLETGLVPIGHARTPAAEAEERRLLYVALSRAVDELHCTWAERRTFATRTVSRDPSPYLEPVQAAVAALARPGAPADWQARIASERQRLRSRPPARRRTRLLGTAADPKVVEALKAWRSATARLSGVPAYVVMHDSTLAAVAEARPSSRADLLALPGLGPVKTERYGDTLLAVLAGCS